MLLLIGGAVVLLLVVSILAVTANRAAPPRTVTGARTRAPLGIEDRPDWPAQSRELLRRNQERPEGD